MSNSENNKSGFFTWMKQSLGVRLVALGILALILLIPLEFAKDLFQQRERYQRESVNEVGGKWGGEQIISGPVLRIPYTYEVKQVSADGESFSWITQLSNFYVLPDSLNIVGDIETEVRTRGVYEIIVYQSAIKMDGYFSDYGNDKWESWGVDPDKIAWKDAVIEFSVGDAKGITSLIEIDWSGNLFELEHGQSKSTVHNATENGFYSEYNVSTDSNFMMTNVPIVLDEKKPTQNTFELAFTLNGTKKLQFVPLGKTTTASLTSSWDSPSFDGDFLPKSRTIDDTGFSAYWHIIHLNRSFPQQFLSSPNLKNTSFGLSLFQPGNIYQMTDRTGKYGFMIIALTLLAFFFFQLFYPIRVHSFHLFLIGLALCIFYALLIAISERINFTISYLISSFATISLIVIFSWSIMKRFSLAMSLGGILVILYGVIYWLIQLEDPLLMGTLIIFSILAVLMALSSKINWYNNNVNSEITK